MTILTIFSLTGSWTQSLKPGNPANVSWLNSNQTSVREDLPYSEKDIEHVIEWVKRHVETTWHSLGTCSMAPREGNDIVKHGVLDERLNVHGVKGLKVADLSICPDNVGWYVYSTIVPTVYTASYLAYAKITTATPTQLPSSLAKSAPCSSPKTWATLVKHWR